MSSIGPAPVAPAEYVAELRAQQENNELLNAIDAALRTLRTQLKDLAAWREAQMHRLADEERTCERALGDLNRRKSRPTEKLQEDQIAASIALVERERAELTRRCESREAIHVLHLLEDLGIDRRLLLGLERRRQELFPAVDKLRVKVAVALSVLMTHGWQLDEGANQVGKLLNDLGIGLPPTFGRRDGSAVRKRRLTITEQIKECRRDVKVGKYKKMARETRPQSWRDAFAAVTATATATGPHGRPLAGGRSKWTMETPGLSALPASDELAQSYFDSLVHKTEWTYAALRGDGATPRDAALGASRWVLALPDG